MCSSLTYVPHKALRKLASVLRLPPDLLEPLSSSDGRTVCCPNADWLAYQENVINHLPSEFHRGSVGIWVSQFAKKIAMKASGGPDHLAIKAAEDGLRLEAKLGPRDAPTVLCHAHQKLHPELIRMLFHFLSHEIADRADPVRRHPKHTNNCHTESHDVPRQVEEYRHALVETGESPSNDCHTDEIRAWGDRMMGISALWTEPNTFRELELGLLGARVSSPPFLTPDGRHLKAPPVRLLDAGTKLAHLAFPCEACTLAVIGGNWRALVDLRAGMLSRAVAEENKRLLRKRKDKREQKRSRRHCRQHNHRGHRSRRHSSPRRTGRTDRTEITVEADKLDRQRSKDPRRHAASNDDLLPLIDVWLEIMDRDRKDYCVDDFYCLLGLQTDHGYYVNAPSVSQLLYHVSGKLADKIVGVRLCEADRRKLLREKDRRRSERRRSEHHPDTRPLAKPRPGRQPLNGGDECLECPSRMTTRHGHRLPLPLLPVDRDGWVSQLNEKNGDRRSCIPHSQEEHIFVEEDPYDNEHGYPGENPAQSDLRRNYEPAGLPILIPRTSGRTVRSRAAPSKTSLSKSANLPSSYTSRQLRQSHVGYEVAINEPSDRHKSLAVSVYEMGTPSAASRTASRTASRVASKTTQATTQSLSQAGSYYMSGAMRSPGDTASSPSGEHYVVSEASDEETPGSTASQASDDKSMSSSSVSEEDCHSTSTHAYCSRAQSSTVSRASPQNITVAPCVDAQTVNSPKGPENEIPNDSDVVSSILNKYEHSRVNGGDIDNPRMSGNRAEDEDSVADTVSEHEKDEEGEEGEEDDMTDEDQASELDDCTDDREYGREDDEDEYEDEGQNNSDGNEEDEDEGEVDEHNEIKDNLPEDGIHGEPDDDQLSSPDVASLLSSTPPVPIVLESMEGHIGSSVKTAASKTEVPRLAENEDISPRNRNTTRGTIQRTPEPRVGSSLMSNQARKGKYPVTGSPESPSKGPPAAEAPERLGKKTQSFSSRLSHEGSRSSRHTPNLYKPTPPLPPPSTASIKTKKHMIASSIRSQAPGALQREYKLLDGAARRIQTQKNMALTQMKSYSTAAVDKRRPEGYESDGGVSYVPTSVTPDDSISCVMAREQIEREWEKRERLEVQTLQKPPKDAKQQKDGFGGKNILLGLLGLGKKRKAGHKGKSKNMGPSSKSPHKSSLRRHNSSGKQVSSSSKGHRDEGAGKPREVRGSLYALRKMRDQREQERKEEGKVPRAGQSSGNRRSRSGMHNHSKEVSGSLHTLRKMKARRERGTEDGKSSRPPTAPLASGGGLLSASAGRDSRGGSHYGQKSHHRGSQRVYRRESGPGDDAMMASGSNAPSSRRSRHQGSSARLDKAKQPDADADARGG